MADAKFSTLNHNPFCFLDTSLTIGNFIVDASNEGVAWTFQTINANAITHLGFRYGARTGTPPSYIISLQTVSATTGQPTGTIVGGGTPASAIFTPPASTAWDGLWQWVALDNSYTPGRGDVLAVVIEYSSGTINGSNASSFTSNVSITAGGTLNFPANCAKTAGAWNFATGYTAVFGVRTATERYGNIFQANYGTRSASTVGHRVALKFRLDSDWGSTFKVVGLRGFISPANATGKTPKFGLWNSGGMIQDVTLDSDYWPNPIATRSIEVMFNEASLTALDYGTDYYLGVEVMDAVSGDAVIRGFSVAENADLAAHPGRTTWILSTYNGSSWSDVNTVRPAISPIFDDFTEPSGGGGGALLLGGLGQTGIGAF